MSKINKICKLKLKKENILGLMKAKNVSMHKKIQTNNSTITNLNFLRLFNIQKQHLTYINII